MLENSVLYVNRVRAHLVSILLMSLPFPKCLPERIAITVPFVFGKMARLLDVRAFNCTL